MGLRTRNGRKRDNRGGDDEDWIATYADAITLLMAFFVVLYSMSDIKEERFTAVRAGIIEALAGSNDAEGDQGEQGEEEQFNEAMSRMVQRLTELVANGTLEIATTPKGVVLEFNSRALYAVGSAEILPKSKPMLNRIAARIKQLGDVQLTVTVEGHTDDTPIKTARYPSNWELSTARATNIVRHFVERKVDPKVLRAAGYADMQPKYPNLDAGGAALPENRAKNRRVVIKMERY